jgi:hypothetical protein
MDSPHTQKCPRCGAAVVLPTYCRVGEGPPNAKRLDQVARAVCGCWAVDLPEEATLRLVKVLAEGLTEPGSRRLGTLKAGT